MVAVLLGADTVLTAVLGVTLAYFGVVPPVVGFIIFALAFPIGIVALIVSLVGLRRARAAGAGAEKQVGLARRGLVLAGVTLAVILLPALTTGNVPRINDITTDTDDPPVFVKALTHGPNQGRDMSYPGVDFATQQIEAYPDIEPIKIPVPPAEAFEKIRSALTELPNTEVTDADPEEGRIEGSCTSRLFRFVDDVVIRVRPYGEGRGAGSLIDIRSKSRDGKSDLGANAKRIRTLREALFR